MIDAVVHLAHTSPDFVDTYPSPVSGHSVLAKICGAVPQDVKPQWETPTFEVIERQEYTPSAPRYSSRHLQQINLILIKHRTSELCLENINQSLKNHHQQSYSSYVEYCNMIGGVCPRTLEHWDEQRDKQKMLDAKLLPYKKADIVGTQQFVACNVCKPGTTPHAACLRDVVEHPITFFEHIARAAFRPSLDRKTITVKVPRPTLIDKDIRLPHGSFRFKVNEGELSLPHASLWCKTCVETTHLTTINGVDIVREQRGKFVQQEHECSVPTISNDSMSLDRLQGWLNHRTRRFATPRSWAFTHPALSEEHRPSLCLPVVSYTPPTLTYSSGVDYLRVVNPRTCKHLQNRSFTFGTGETIKMCPDCTRVDKHRKAVLKNGTVPQPNAEMIAFWDLRLREYARQLSSTWDRATLAGGYQLCNDCGEILLTGDGVYHRRDGAYIHINPLKTKPCNPLKNPLDLSVWGPGNPRYGKLEGFYGLADKLETTIVHAIAQDALSGGKKVNTHSWSEEKDVEDDLHALVNPDKQDRCVRDHRAYGIVKASRPDKKATTREGWSFKVCPYSKCPLHEPFLGPANKKYCTPNCCKRHNEEKNAA